MNVWLTSCVLLFVLAQVYQSLEHMTLPLPVFILGGVLLAIASNFDKQAGLPLRFRSPQAVQPLPLTPSPAAPLQPTPSSTADQTPPPQRSISFVIQEQPSTTESNGW